MGQTRTGVDQLAWRLRRLRRMSGLEVCWRVEDRARQALWARRRLGAATAPGAAHRTARRSVLGGRRAPAFPASVDLEALDGAERDELLAAADMLLAGRARLLGSLRTDMLEPAWSLDPTTGRSFAEGRCAFRVDYRAGSERRSVKHVWELSRHQHLTVLALAWRCSGDERYPRMIADHLASWWSKNPVLMGVNWASGIELGIRLISWAWVRRLLTGWATAPSLFEDNGVAQHQLYWHQRYLEAFPSRGSSANNHAIAEAAGQLVASCAFPWFAESGRWRAQGAARLETQLARNTFADGVNREQAFEYHGLVVELGLAAAAEAEAAGAPLSQATWDLLCAMLDVTAAVCDRSGRPPRYGDADDGRALVLTAPTTDRWRSLLATGAAVFGAQPWWPATVPDPQSALLAALVGRRVPVGARPPARPSHFPDAGLTILRSPSGSDHELWCRSDGGPHGFLSIAAHAHADALSVEVRYDGTEVLVDPGTYCYQGNPTWRAYFRSTLAHNTVELDGQDQSLAGGPFMWSKAARTTIGEVVVDGDGPQQWSATHDGYRRLASPAVHRRDVRLDPSRSSLELVDHLASEGAHTVRLAFHLGPDVECDLAGHLATLRWTSPRGDGVAATLALAPELVWTRHRGSTTPLLGWYSSGFGEAVPTTTLLGTGRMAHGELQSRLQVVTPPS